MQQLTNEEKAKVFAMYLGAKYCDERKIMYPVSGRVITQVINGTFPKCYKISLTPLSSITDEHAIEVAKIAYAHLEVSYTDETNMHEGRYIVQHHVKLDTNYSLHQYLISKGYDVPLWHGVNHPLNGQTAIQIGIAIDKYSQTPSNR